MLRLLLHAPFAACRTFTAGWYRPTAAFLTPSAAYGLLLNIAGIESRLREGDAEHDGRVAATFTRTDLPRFKVAIGLPDGIEPPRVQSVYQQLHNYPVGSQAGQPSELAKGNKNNISPVRREILTDVTAVIAVDPERNFDLETQIARGLRGELNATRYGLPFLGDNSFLVDRLAMLGTDAHVRWYERADVAASGARPHVTRLTVRIDRADMSRTVSHLFAPGDAVTIDPPTSAWVDVGHW